MKKIKLSFNKKSKADILSVIAVGAGVIVTVLSSVGVTISTDQISAWSSLVLYVGGGLGLLRNTSTGTSQSQQVNESSESVSKTLDLAWKFADTVVPELAVIVALSKSDRKKEAIRYINIELSKLGLSVDSQTASALAEKAYQAYKVSGGDNHDPLTAPAAEEDAEADSDEGADSDE